MLSKSLRRSFTAFTRVRFKLPHTNSYSSDINVESATDKHLRQDINQLGSILSTAIRGESVSFFESVEKLRVLGHEASRRSLEFRTLYNMLCNLTFYSFLRFRDVIKAIPAMNPLIKWLRK